MVLSARFTYMKTLWPPLTRTATMTPVPKLPEPSVFEMSTWCEVMGAWTGLSTVQSSVKRARG